MSRLQGISPRSQYGKLQREVYVDKREHSCRLKEIEM